ncbi:MAG: 8-amino-7-oxononanoate synthase [Rhodoglobus sp.]
MTGPTINAWIDRQATVRIQRATERSLRVRTSDATTIDLASNDYLGLVRDERLVRAAQEALEQWGTGATASRLVAGTTALHDDLEQSLALLTGMDTALVFSSGYLANIGVITALGGPGTGIFSDDHCHASIVDGLRLSRSPAHSFAHNDLDDLERLLRNRAQPRALVIVESVYSVLGDAAPLGELLALVERYDAILLVDEAHSLGVTGGGRGSVFAAGLAGHPHVIATATLSKALASQGGAVLASEKIREHLINRSRTFIFDTGLAPASAAAARAAVEIINSEPWRSDQVHRNSALLESYIQAATEGQHRYEPGAMGAVRSIQLRDAASAALAAGLALDAGVWVGCFRPPSVPDGISRLRVTARASLTIPEIARASTVLAEVLAATR